MFRLKDDEDYILATLDELLGDEEDELLDSESV
jgi:hypothetical protein